MSSRSSWLTRRLSRRGQQGYILATVLGAMLVGLTLITALLGMSFSTHRSAIIQQDLSRERRAADGALEVAMQEIRTDPEDPCSAVDATVDMRVDRDPGDDHVWVTCDDNVLDPTPAAAGNLQVLGTADYAGTHPWDTTVVPAPASGASLLHQGEQPASFVGGVAVADAGGFNSDALDDGGADPGAEVSGSYAQGEIGTDGNATYPCGILDADAGGAVVRTVETVDAGPRCEDTTLAATLGSLTPNVPSTPLPTTSDVPAGCPDAGSHSFAPGFYGADETAALSVLFQENCDSLYEFQPGIYWFDGAAGVPLVFADARSDFVFGEPDGGTPNRCETEPVTGDDGTIAENLTTIVLGPTTEVRHTGGNLSICAGHDLAGNPNPDPALVRADGLAASPEFVSVASGATGADDVVPCESWIGCLNRHAFGFKFVDDAHEASFLAGAQSTTAVMCAGNKLLTDGVLGSCNTNPDWPFDTFLEFGISSPGTQPLDRLEFRWDNFESPVSKLDLSRSVVATLYDESRAELCTTGRTGRGRTNGVGSSIDLTAPCVGSGSIVAASDLDGATLRVSFPTNHADGTCLGQCPWTLTVASPSLVLNAGTSEASAAPSDSSDWVDPQNVVGDTSGYATAEADCTYTHLGVPVQDVCDRPSGSTDMRWMTLSGFSLPEGMVEDDDLTSLALAIDTEIGAADQSNLVANPSFNPLGDLELGSTRVEVLDDAGTVVCFVEKAGYPRPLTTWYADLSDCNFTAQDIEEHDVRLGIAPERNMYLPTSWFDPFGSSQKVDGPGLELPSISHARLEATTESFTDGSFALLSVEEGHSTNVRLQGDSDLHLVDVDVEWKGEASEDSLFTGTLTVNALSSWQDTTVPAGSEVGTVCCGPNYPNLMLKAYVSDPLVGSPPIRGLARVRLVAEGDTRRPVIADWQLCHLDGCPAL